MRDDDPDFLAWAKTVPPEITTDTIWRTPAYRLALYVMELAQADIPRLLANRSSRPHVDQLLRAVGALSADLDEGYSRSSGRERAHYYECGAGSTREARGWCYKCRAAFKPGGRGGTPSAIESDHSDPDRDHPARTGTEGDEAETARDAGTYATTRSPSSIQHQLTATSSVS